MKIVCKVIDSAIDKILSAMGLISVVMMVLLSLFITTQVFCRYFLSVHVPGLFDLSIYSLIIFTFLSAAYTLREGKHISVDLLSSHLPEGARVGLEISAYTAALFFVVILGWFGWKWAYMSFASGVMTISETPIPKGILISAIVLGAFLLSLQMIRSIVSSFM